MKNILLAFFCLVAFTKLSAGNEKQSVSTQEIKTGWKFVQAGKTNWLTASVPGNIHSDLLRNKIIPDPFFGTNEKELQWIGEKDWVYETTFEVDDAILLKNNIELYFYGLDTYAEVTLNDQKILSANNMFRTWNVDAKKLLKKKNTLKIYFLNVFDENMPKYNSAPYRLQAFDNNDQAEIKLNLYSRKAGYHYGWDWGPRLITCGIWRPVVISAWDEIQIDDVQIIQENVSQEKANIKSNLSINSDTEQNVVIKAFVNGNEISSKTSTLQIGANQVALNFTMNNPKLWWPNGLGEHYLYDFEFRIINSNSTVDSKKYKIGIRSIEMVREKDSVGTSFYFNVNGFPLFVKGANYIPQDNLQDRVTPERYRYMIKSAADVNMNMLRVWGGGIYEEDTFYEMCDEYGILVWQEFAFACGMYPSDNDYLLNVRQEVIDNVKRLRNHASLAMYCGNNENEVAWFQWGWKQMYTPEIQKQYEKDYQRLFYEVIPNALKEVDNTRYYHPSSPSASFGNYSVKDGDQHNWSIWHGKEPFEKYNENVARFTSEYGFQSYPEMSTIEKFTKPEDRQLHSEVMLAHQRCMNDARKDKEYGNRLIQTYMERQYNQPKDFENYVYVAQLLQAEGVKIAVEAHRRNMPLSMGTLYWQINDCWPVASWSSIDYYGKWKALHYFIKNVYESIHVAPYLSNNEVNFFIISDKHEAVEAELEIICMDFSGKELFKKEVPVSIKANTSENYLTLAAKELANKNSFSECLVAARIKKGSELISENILYFVPQKELKLPDVNIKVSMVKNDEGYNLELISNALAKNVFLSTPGIETTFSDNYFDLLPNVSKKVSFKTEAEVGDFISKIRYKTLKDSF